MLDSLFEASDESVVEQESIHSDHSQSQHYPDFWYPRNTCHFAWSVGSCFGVFILPCSVSTLLPSWGDSIFREFSSVMKKRKTKMNHHKVGFGRWMWSSSGRKERRRSVSRQRLIINSEWGILSVCCWVMFTVLFIQKLEEGGWNAECSSYVFFHDYVRSRLLVFVFLDALVEWRQSSLFLNLDTLQVLTRRYVTVSASSQESE